MLEVQYRDVQYFFCDKDTQQSLWRGTRAARVKVTIRGRPTPNRINYFVTIFTIKKCGRGPQNTTWRAAGWTLQA
jgi:hypothetical protein